MNDDATKAMQYAKKLLDTSAVVGASHAIVDAVTHDANTNWARDPKVVGLAILCRCISNFNASMTLVNAGHVLEARALVRLMYENLLWIGALRERGAAFLQDMIADEGHNRKALAELTMKISGKHGADVNAPGPLQLRCIINELPKQFPSMKKLHADKIAATGAVEVAYVEYARFSLDTVHCSVTALGRHLFSESQNNTVEHIISVEAQTSQRELFSTILHACRALMGVAIGANELLGFTSETDRLTAAVAEFEQNGWTPRFTTVWPERAAMTGATS